MDNEQIAKKILELLGGRKNVISNVICSTKLSIKIKDASKIQMGRFMEIEEILGVTTDKENMIHIVIGNEKTALIGIEFLKLTELKSVEEYKRNNELNWSDGMEVKDEVGSEEVSLKNVSFLSRFGRKAVSVFLPLLPVIIAAGIIKGLTDTIDIFSEGIIFNGYWWYRLLKLLSWGVFNYLPILVCMSTVREFKGTPVIGGVIGILFSGDSLMPLSVKTGIGNVASSSAQENYIPVLSGLVVVFIIGIMTAYIEKGIRNITPKILRNVGVPLMTLAASSIIAVSVTQFIGRMLTGHIYSGLNTLFEQTEIVGGFILGMFYIPLELLGLNTSLISINNILSSPEGPTAGMNYILPILMMASGGQTGASIAVFIKTRNKRLKKIIRDSLLAGVLGVNEPLVYGVTFPLVRPFITGCIGGGIGGGMAGFLNLVTIYPKMNGIFGFMTVIQGTGKFFILSMTCAYLGGFILTYFMGINEKRINEVYMEK